MCFAPQPRGIFGHHTCKKWSEPVSFLTFSLANVLFATAACNLWTSQLPKWLRPCGVFHILTYKYASRHSGVQFLNIVTSKMAPPLWCFPHFDLQICFSPQRRAIFEHRNVQNGSAPRGVFHILTYKYASRHSGVQFLNIVTSKMAPPPWCFPHFDLQICFAPQRRAIFHLSARTATSAPAALARLLFEHQQPRIIEKTQRFATSLTFFAHVELLATDSARLLIFLRLTLHTCWSSCYWHDCCATLLCNSTYCRKLDF